MKKLFLSLSLVAVFSLIVATAAFAQTSTPYNPGPGGPGGGPRGPMGGTGNNNSGELHEYISASIAEVLGISVDDFLARRESGQTTYAIATELGLNLETLQEDLYNARMAAIQQAIDDGVITADQSGFFQFRGRHGGGGQQNPSGFGNGSRYNGDCPYNTDDNSD